MGIYRSSPIASAPGMEAVKHNTTTPVRIVSSVEFRDLIATGSNEDREEEEEEDDDDDDDDD
ncbi:hypothetical protein PDE_07990 [Penicillium oxalicum 114-2]|uniref:Uncharacterized protein n=1 Tax=Penicillium oxalicum (strain 114-2 / CGMCC 5302) TaxID=933388 RepID=S7ZRH2_PENO1|nr:hypothetical protein PDE_07990 [Penicillium oxalicum 114-2]